MQITHPIDGSTHAYTKTFRAGKGVFALNFCAKNEKKNRNKLIEKKKKETEEGESQANTTQSLGPVRFAVG